MYSIFPNNIITARSIWPTTRLSHTKMPAITGPLTHVLQRQASETLSKDAVDTSTNAPAILANSGVITGIAVIIVLARIYVRCFMLKTFGYDDYFIAAATVRLAM